MARSNERPIIIKKVKKVAGGHHGGAWKVAYADFVTAMMAFFMLLWLISSPDQERLKGLAEYFTPTAPNASPATTLTSDPGAIPGLGGRSRAAQADSKTSVGQPTMEAGVNGTARGGTANVPDASQRVLATELRVAIDTIPQDAQGKQNVDIEPSRDGLRITLMDSDRQSMFRSGTAQLNPYARTILAQVAEKLAPSGAQIAIEGHTDGAGGNSEANWRLSGERALAARGALIAAGLPADRLSEIVAMGATKPVYPDQPDRPENRRITIIVMGETSALPTDSSFKF
ncbi:flagellar motor protein MotB [Stakelama tenebrarum]|uniref:OmpA family protein n=1 Tax=Stakelama tenebrarum TaxID=2711215 RepID=A0A6G6Y476_9SPHN|nr:flagellar motor protein MotB [Sphingosinithalassobacter tenebrarum]QIG79715.1 OmpA family protein [Sphingosinithalassobacter tenebrarum]